MTVFGQLGDALIEHSAGAEIHARHARDEARKAAREPNRAEALAGHAGWKVTADRLSLRLQLRNAFTVAMAGSRWNATGARPGSAFLWQRYGDRAIRDLEIRSRVEKSSMRDAKL